MMTRKVFAPFGAKTANGCVEFVEIAPFGLTGVIGFARMSA